MTRSRNDALKRRYFIMATQYYAAARFAAVTGINPAVGLLFHYSVEMYLKGHLCLRLTKDELKNYLSHDLKKAWKEFKKDFSDPILNEFDRTISMIEKFWRIRYPEEIVDKGMQVRVSFTPPANSLDLKQPEPRYELIVDDIDELVKIIFQKASHRPLSLKGHIPSDAYTYLTKWNKTRIWGDSTG